MALEYPNPVLSAERDDYVESCKFDIYFDESEIVVDDDNIVILAKLELVCEGLKTLIQEKKASVVVLVNSKSSFYRRAYKFSAGADAKKIEIPKFHVKKDIDICGYILAEEEINNFRCEGEFNELYFRGMSFNVRKADVLAQGKNRIIPVDDSELEKPISSIFLIEKNILSDAEIESDFDTDEKIIIRLNERLNQLYWDFKEKDNGILHRYLNGVVVYPVLVEAISKIVDYYRGSGSDDHAEKRWFRAIEHKLRSFNVDIEQDYDQYSYVELADKLLGGISYDALINVKTTLDNELNNGEHINTGGID